MKYLVLFCFSLIAQAETAAVKPVDAEEEQIVERVECTLGKDIRKLEVQTLKAGCTLHYFKAGKTEVIASYKRGVEPCLDTFKKVRSNLEHSGCQLVSGNKW